jgi:hypothetical protein
MFIKPAKGAALRPIAGRARSYRYCAVPVGAGLPRDEARKTNLYFG